MPRTARSTLLAATALAAVGALAATPAAAQPVTGLYIAGGGGGNFMQNESLSVTERVGASTYNQNATAFSKASTTTYPAFAYGYHQQFGLDAGGVAVASVGYGLGNGLRFEIEGDYRYNGISYSRQAEQKYGGMANAIYDLPVNFFGITPYAGLGAGYMWIDRGQGAGTTSAFAYQFIGGGSYAIPPVPGLSLTLEYRFMGLAGTERGFNDAGYAYASSFSSYTQNPGTGKTKYSDDYNHSVLIGLRYAFNAAPPPVVAPIAPAPVAADAARTYLVFFDWDRADLTDRARQIIAAAAQATTRTQVTRIEVNGNTDTTGTASYNQALSLRRARAVAAELVRDGVPAAAIATQGFGFAHLLVPTGPGVREPQNRRVEIILR